MKKIKLKLFRNDVFHTKVYSVFVDGSVTNIRVHRSWCGQEATLHQWALELGLVSIDSPGHPSIDYKRCQTLADAKQLIAEYLSSTSSPVNVEINITGSGTVYQLRTALHTIVQSLANMSPAELAGKTWEDATLCTQFKEPQSIE